jgi:hypothetical protein
MCGGEKRAREFLQLYSRTVPVLWWILWWQQHKRGRKLAQLHWQLQKVTDYLELSASGARSAPPKGHMVVATGMPTDGASSGSSAPSTSRDDGMRSDASSVAGALPPEVMQILAGPRTVNEEGHSEEPPPLPEATLAPAFSKENLEALRAERLARRTAAANSASLQGGGSARPSKPATHFASDIILPAASHRAKGENKSSRSSPPNSESRKSSRQKSTEKSNRVYLTMSSARAAAIPEMLPLNPLEA